MFNLLNFVQFSLFFFRGQSGFVNGQQAAQCWGRFAGWWEST